MTTEGGRRLKAFVERKRDTGLTMLEFAALVGVSKSALHAWFAGTKEPTMEHLRRLAEVLNVPVWEIVKAMENGKTPPT